MIEVTPTKKERTSNATKLFVTASPWVLLGLVHAEAERIAHHS
jgi:hypothetical protein